MATVPDYPPAAYSTLFSYDTRNTMSQPFIGDTHVPMPSSMSESIVVKGATIDLPNGDTNTQERYRAREIVWTWDGLSYSEEEILRAAINNAAFDTTLLFIPTPFVEYNPITEVPYYACVKPSGSNVYKATIRYNAAAQRTRWTVTMSWIETPDDCTPPAE